MSMRFIRFKELRQRIPLGRTTIWKMMREGRFPQSRRIGKMAAAWLESEVEDWMKKNAGLRKVNQRSTNMNKSALSSTLPDEIVCDVRKRVILSMGGKGGVGKTSIMVGLAEWFDRKPDSRETARPGY